MKTNSMTKAKEVLDQLVEKDGLDIPSMTQRKMEVRISNVFESGVVEPGLIVDAMVEEDGLDVPSMMHRSIEKRIHAIHTSSQD